MQQQSFTLGSSKTVASVIVGLTVGLMAAATLLHSHTLHHWAVVCCVASAVAWIRHYFIQHAQAVADIHEGTPTKHIESLERAFSLGMAAERAAHPAPPNVHHLNGTTH